MTDPVHRAEVIVVGSEADAAEVAAKRIADALARALFERRVARWATTGGSTALPIYEALLDRDDARLAWDRIEVWTGDERFVSRTDPLSNIGLADALLAATAGGPLPDENVHAWPTDEALRDGRGPEWCAERMADAADILLPQRDGIPVFDVVGLGMGADGHILSVFPGAAPLPGGAITAAVAAPEHVEPHVQRLMFTPRIVDTAPAIIVVAFGEAKADAVADAFAPGDTVSIPARRAVRANATWIIDQAAAARLPALSS